jgi:hypothetical protein
MREDGGLSLRGYLTSKHRPAPLSSGLPSPLGECCSQAPLMWEEAGSDSNDTKVEWSHAGKCTKLVTLVV